ncbi:MULTISPECIES: hypothetical protein [unclassified Phenylobacterium]|uniref:hypothetical protein n=1 Tax=unclassified Phenylobacterium TaxID=2640670 RepID=UPI00083A3AA5|nr:MULTISPECIES: hypothetical protein [unclassified Phenylobacterium]
MNSESLEALTNARRLVRTLDAAPDPLRQAQAAISGLIRAKGWAPDQEHAILALAEWLAQRPPVTALKPRCQALLKTLA